MVLHIFGVCVGLAQLGVGIYAFTSVIPCISIFGYCGTNAFPYVPIVVLGCLCTIMSLVFFIIMIMFINGNICYPSVDVMYTNGTQISPNNQYVKNTF